MGWGDVHSSLYNSLPVLLLNRLRICGNVMEDLEEEENSIFRTVSKKRPPTHPPLSSLTPPLSAVIVVSFTHQIFYPFEEERPRGKR